jgi:hypothetical protein
LQGLFIHLCNRIYKGSKTFNSGYQEDHPDLRDSQKESGAVIHDALISLAERQHTSRAFAIATWLSMQSVKGFDKLYTAILTPCTIIISQHCGKLLHVVPIIGFDQSVL